MRASMRKLAFIVIGSILLFLGMFPASLRAQQTTDNDSPKFLQINPPTGTVVAATEVTITGQVEDASPVEVAAGDLKVKADKTGHFAPCSIWKYRLKS